MSKRKLRKIAKRIYEITRRETWLGGKVTNTLGPGAAWPKEIKKIEWGAGLTWTMSPEVELVGYRLRVLISLKPDLDFPYIRVFVDNKLKHPGGEIEARHFFGDGWARRIAQQEREAGGETGPVDVQDVVLREAALKLKGVFTDQEPQPVYCALCGEALKEVDHLLPDTPKQLCEPEKGLVSSTTE